MPTHWNTAIKLLDEEKILEDFLPERDKYSYIINKFILSDKSDIRYETKFIAGIEVNMSNVWSSALHILCQWHTLNAVWRFCNNGKNGIKKPD